MRILIEDYQYSAFFVKDFLDGISKLHDINDNVSVNYVGYYYNSLLKDCVFILPKVLIDKNEKVFGHYDPEEIVHLESTENPLNDEERRFVYELAVWIYRAIVVYNDGNPDNTIVRRQYVAQMSKTRLRQSNTFLDILLALQKFNRENQQFFFFILKNIHSGCNKINWNKTISRNRVFIQDEVPIYTQIVNKKRKINFDEELLVIFFSILNFMHEEYGFPVNITLGFELIKGKQFKQYMDGFGCNRLRQIKYKYFSDKAIYLWELCFAFFDQSKKINVETTEQEYLLVTNFNIVFESIIDELIGDPRDKIPDGLKDQDDGKRVDHLYRYKDLINGDCENSVYYIGDSKYYKQKTKIGPESIYKQFTYARNVIQWNLDLFNDGQESNGILKLRDDITEGYNVVPNFFISAQQNSLKQEDDIDLFKDHPYYLSKQFENRLFDRDTLLVARYNVNFLFIIALYGRNNQSQKNAWKEKIRCRFRAEIQTMLSKQYNFYVMTAHSDVDADQYMRENFQMVLGKVFSPFKDRDYYSIALSNDLKYKEDNELLLDLLRQNFDLKECAIGVDPATILPKNPKVLRAVPMALYLTRHWLENYLNANILVGCYKNQSHLDWILGKNDKKTLLYNVRLDGSRAGTMPITQVRTEKVSFVVLYNFSNAMETRVFRVHHTAVMDEDRMRKAMYPNPHGRYFCYVFDEQVSLGDLDIVKLLQEKQELDKGTPIYLKGSDLIKYRS